MPVASMGHNVTEYGSRGGAVSKLPIFSRIAVKARRRCLPNSPVMSNDRPVMSLSPSRAKYQSRLTSKYRSSTNHSGAATAAAAATAEVVGMDYLVMIADDVNLHKMEYRMSAGRRMCCNI